MPAADRTLGTSWDGHLLLLTSSEQERASGLAAWIRRGLDAGEKVLFAQEKPEDPRPLASPLETVGVDPASVAEQGQLAVLPLSAFYLPDERRALMEKARAEGFERLRLSIDAAAAPMLLRRPVAHRHFERTIDEMCHTNHVSFLCQASRQDTPLETQRDIVRIHSTGLRQQTLHTNGAQQGIALEGELDKSNADVLELVVERTPNASAGIFRLDLSRVTFVDAEACEALLRGTRDFRLRGGRVCLVEPQPAVLETLDLLEIDADEGMVLLAKGAR